MSFTNVKISPVDEWKEISNLSAGMFTLTTGGQWCKNTGVPSADLIGHRVAKKPVFFTCDAGESIYVKVQRDCFALVMPFSTSCNIYIFSDTNPDLLELGSPFTGNLKVQIASDSETGIHPDIIAGRQGAFVASTDVINDPQWVQYEISAVAIEWLVDATYNGRIAYAKDDVWNYLDMGAPVTSSSFVWSSNFVWS